MKSQDAIAIKVSGVSKSFKLPHEKQNSIKSLFVGMFKGKRTYEKQQVLKNVSFEVKKGEFFGIVGRNGGGKSTMLKLLAGIYNADKGSVEVNGKLTPFIELGVGFNPELTGRENVFLNGALLGFNRAEMEEMYKDIVAFAELEKFMDQKLKNYSSGMQVRLAFSIAIRAKSEILLIDEVLAVGDAAFQAKCFDTFAKLKDLGRTIILVTHDMNSVLRFCDRAMLLNGGKIEEIGKPTDIADSYLELNFEQDKSESDTTKQSIIKSVELLTEQKHATSLRSNSPASLLMSYVNNTNDKIHLGMQIFNDAGVYCFGTNTKIYGLKPIEGQKGKVRVDMPSLNLLSGSYYITLAVMSENLANVIEYRSKIVEFRITKDSEYEGIVMTDHTWEINV